MDVLAAAIKSRVTVLKRRCVGGIKNCGMPIGVGRKTGSQKSFSEGLMGMKLVVSGLGLCRVRDWSDDHDEMR